MTKPSEKLASSLELLARFQNKNGIAVIRSGYLPRSHKDRLVSKGFLREVMKGWYISSRSDEVEGDSTSWYVSYWDFISVYLKERFENDWCLSPEQSLNIHSGNKAIPKQLLVRSPKAGNNKVSLLFNTSLFDLTSSIPPKKDITEKDGLNLFSIPSALISCSPGFFTQHPTDARTVLSMITDASELLYKLLDGGHTTIAGRLAGAFRNIGNDPIADEILSAFKSADYDIRESDPFELKPPVISITRENSQYVKRIKWMWQHMRGHIIERFPDPPGVPKNIAEYLGEVDELYVTDAYHSLSIEGYRVSPELIEKVKSGRWNPAEDESDRKQVDALAARGYWQAFQSVKSSIRSIMAGNNPGMIAENDHRDWYRELFAPSVAAGILKTSDLAGYRNSQVYIKESMYTPPGMMAVRDSMPALFELLKNEKEPSVRALLGHFFFVYIHPYTDGNGRIARFLMNAMFASGGYPWMVIRVEDRKEYMESLEKASVDQDITAFTEFIVKINRK
jgi:fido (protein-threonine AMPylation protein)